LTVNRVHFTKKCSRIPWLGGAESHEGIAVLAARTFGSDAETAFILKQGADGAPAAEIGRRAGISQATDFNGKKYDGLLTTTMRRLKQLEDENGKRRKLVAALSLDKEMLQDVIH
jgi:putative transposase